MTNPCYVMVHNMAVCYRYVLYDFLSVCYRKIRQFMNINYSTKCYETAGTVESN